MKPIRDELRKGARAMVLEDEENASVERKQTVSWVERLGDKLRKNATAYRTVFSSWVMCSVK